jgi:NADPH2:quinone reductase
LSSVAPISSLPSCPSSRAKVQPVKNIEVTGLQITDYRKRRPSELRTAYAEIFGYRALGLIKSAPIVPFALQDAGRALAAVRDRRIEGRAILLVHED